MAREEPWIKIHVKLDHDFSVTAMVFRVIFKLQIRLYLTDDNGNIVGEGAADGLHDRSLLLEFEFGRQPHRRRVANLLREAGWPDERSLEKFLDKAFKDGRSELQESVKTSLRNRGVPIITFCVCKYVKWEVEPPKPVPATRESIQALKTLRLEADDGAQDQECMICMGQLCPGTEVTSMPCLHLFHGDCLRKWLNVSHMCPLCRFSMPADG